MNRVILIGNLGRDAELRYTGGGTPVSSLNIATTETWKDKQGKKQEQTEWHRIVLWGTMAENLNEFLVKGKQIAVEGKLQTRKWSDKDGVERYTTEIKADRVTLLGGQQQRSNSGGGARNTNTGTNGGAMIHGPETDGPDDAGSEIDDDDIPF
jgi:single-strand DNA-binding protein